jgi:hypothetical protein
VPQKWHYIGSPPALSLPAQLNLCIQLLTALLMLTSESLTPHSNLVAPGLAKRYLWCGQAVQG